MLYERYTGMRFQIDTNRINAKQLISNMNQLEKWHETGVIKIEMSEPSRFEALYGNDENRNEKTNQYGYSYTLASTPKEKDVLCSIEEILFPNGVQNKNQRNDVEIVFNAKKYVRILITNDGDSKSQPGGILGNKDRLKVEIGVDVITDEEAVKRVKARILIRDNWAKREAERREIELPNWVGTDD